MNNFKINKASKLNTVYIDISDLYRSKSKTGIQRAVREIVKRLVKEKRGNLEVNVLNFNAKKHKYEIFKYDDIENFMLMEKNEIIISKTVKISDLKKNSIFFDMDSSWNIPLKRPYLYKELKKNNIKIISYLYDMIPIVHPEYAHSNTLRNFVSYIGAVMTYSDMVFCISRCTETDFISYKRKLGIERHIPTLVTKLGVDFEVIRSEIDKNEASLVDSFINSKYILFVGTIEPRKKHQLALDSLDRIVSANPSFHLVFAGKLGWNSESVMANIKKHKLYNKNLHWVDTPSDALLNKLYEKCFMGLYLSNYEGFGLPIGELLGYNKITIASKNSSMYEVGKDYVDYTVFNTENEIVEIINEYLDNDKLYKKRLDYIKKNYKPYTWDGVYDIVFTAIDGISSVSKFKKEISIPKNLQAVFISNNFEKLNSNIGLIDDKINFINEYIIVAPGYLSDDIKKINSSNKIIHISDEKILGDRLEEFKRSDHVVKNWMLRSSLVYLDEIGDEFIMLDDDNCPLIDVDMNVFINKNRTYNAYYFYDIANWTHNLTDFDRGLYNTSKLLDSRNFELLAYASHQPQIINKSIFKDAINEYGNDAMGTCVDEWSAYFNYAVTRYPSLFNKKVFISMNWPARPTDWQSTYRPERYVFENYYDHLYVGSNEIFKGVKRTDLVQKIEIKNDQMKIYNNAIDIYNYSNDIIEDCNIAHGLIKFNIDDEKIIYIHGMPYLVVTGKKAYIRIDLSYQVIGNNSEDDEIYLCYEAHGVSVNRRAIILDKTNVNGYYCGVITLPIVSKGYGASDIDLYVLFNGKKIYGNSVGVSKMLVTESIDSIESSIVKYL